jgi:hypothetical protein
MSCSIYRNSGENMFGLYKVKQLKGTFLKKDEPNKN